MKTLFGLILALTVLSNLAHASRARLEALGEGKDGSYYLNDARNMFLNPASITQHKKKLLLELGLADAGGGIDTPVDRRAQGGYIDSLGDLTYAVYLNNVSNASVSTFTPVPTGAIELALAGEGLANWGVSLVRGYGPTGANTVDTWGTRFGVSKDALSVFGTLGLYGRSIDSGVETRTKLNLDLGATYRLGDFTLLGNYQGGSLKDDSVKSQAYGLGAGYQKQITQSVLVLGRVEARKFKLENSGPFNQNSWNLPVVVGAEAQALSWLVVRGSISHSLMGQIDQANTSVAAGVGLTFGDVTVDGLVATNNSTAVAQNLGTNGLASNSAFGFGDNMISRIAMTYNF
jgi:hypothetical protein